MACNAKEELLSPQQPSVITPGSVTSPTAANALYAGALDRWKRAMNGGGWIRSFIPSSGLYAGYRYQVSSQTIQLPYDTNAEADVSFSVALPPG